MRFGSARSRWFGRTVTLGLALAACNRGGDQTPAAVDQGAARPLTTAGVPTTPAAAPDPLRARWEGAQAPIWQAHWAPDVLITAPAPGLDPDAVDVALRPLAAALRTLPGVETVATRARAGEARVLVRVDAGTTAGPAALAAVKASWRAAPGGAFGPAQFGLIARGARAMAALDSVAPGGRVAATRYADEHVGAVVAAGRAATRSHVAGGVRAYIGVRAIPSALAANGLTLSDAHAALGKWLDNAQAEASVPTADGIRTALHAIALPRRWTANGQRLTDVALDRVVDPALEQGEPLREARNGHLPTTLWLVDGAAAQEVGAIEAAARGVAEASAGQFRPSVQAFSAACRVLLTAADGKKVDTPDELGQRLLALRQGNENLVAINGIAGADGIPEFVDTDASERARWTLWLSLASPDIGPVLFAAREALAAGGWDVHILGERLDTGLCWLLDAWGAAGAVISAEDPAQLAPAVADVAQRALAGREKAGTRQGPQAGLAAPAFRRIDPRALAGLKLPAAAASLFVASLTRATPVGWLHGTPVWFGLPTGELSATVGDIPLAFVGTAPTTQPRRAAEVLRVPDTAGSVERVRVNGRPALWIVAENYADAPQNVAESFWRMVESSVDLRAGMRVDSLDLRHKRLALESATP